MGLLVNGVWQDQWYDTASTGGRFVRKGSQFRDRIGPGTPYAAEAGRYHLYVSRACPWAHRTLIMRRLKGLEGMIGLSVVHWLMLENGWTFAEGPGVIADPIHKARYLYEVYRAAAPDYTGRVTVPVLWDKQSATIVNNESAEIIRLFNSAFDHLGALPGDYYPAEHAEEIDAINLRVYDTVNNGVYRAGFATTQAAYEEAVAPLFESLDWLDRRLAAEPYLVGGRLTEADIRLFTTLIRFDAVYHGHFKCNIRRIADYRGLFPYLCRLLEQPGFGDTVDFAHIKGHYYGSHRTINPTGIVPVGPEIDYKAGLG